MSVLPAGDAAFELRAPVVVIGAGAAGLVAALAARDAGAEVMVLERDPMPTGATSLSVGLVPAAGTRWQRRAGVKDAPDQLAADILAKVDDPPAPDLLAAVTRGAAPTLEWLADRHGFDFSLVLDLRYPGHSAQRMHGLPTRRGGELVTRLREAALSAGVIVRCRCAVTDLYAQPDGRVTGVAYDGPEGRRILGCDALVLGCSGFGANRSLVAELMPEMRHALYFGHAGSRGDAVLWGRALGAAIRHQGGHVGHASVAHPPGVLITWTTIMEGGIQVNAQGLRFADETLGYSEQAAPLLAQPDRHAWTVFDTRIAAAARRFQDFRAAEAEGAVETSYELDKLARHMRVPVETFLGTIQEVERLKLSGVPDAFGRSFKGLPPLRPPFHAVRVTAALFHTQGGLAVDGRAKVLRRDGTPLPNLFAAGGAACGVSGSSGVGYLSGNGLLTAFVLGRLAGEEAARRAAEDVAEWGSASQAGQGLSQSL